MGYADGLLTTGEHVVHREKQHWWVFVWGAKVTILAVIAAILLLILSQNMAQDGASGTMRTILGWVSAALLIGGVALLIWTTLRYLNQEYVLTNRRVIETEGVINKRAADSSLEKINDAVLTQSIFGRWLGFGDLRVLTASDAAISEFQMIQRPIEFKKAMLDAKYEYEREVAGTGEYAPPSPPFRTEPAAPTEPASSTMTLAGTSKSPAPSATGDETRATTTPASPSPGALSADDLTRTLASLADLRDRGAITAEEYERKKADLLGRL